MNNYFKTYDAQMEQVNSQVNEWISSAMQSGNSNREKAEKEKALHEEGFIKYVTPEMQDVWIPAPKAPTSAIQDYQKGFSSMSPETLREVYPFLQHAEKHYIPIIDQLHDQVNKGEISLQYVQEAIIKMILEGTKEAIDATGGMSKQGDSPIAKASSNAQAMAIYAKSPTAVKELMGGEQDGTDK